MRIFIALSLLACALPTFAQEQESKLLDRLLRPDMKLQNAAQNKEFIADGGRSHVNKQAVVASFQDQKKSITRQFPAEHEFSATNFATHHFRDGDATPSIPRNARLTKTANVTTNSTNATRKAMGSGRNRDNVRFRELPPVSRSGQESEGAQSAEQAAHH